MVGWLLLGARAFVDLARPQMLSEAWGQQEMIDSNAAVVFKGVSKIVPEGKVTTLPRMQETKRIGITKIDESAIAGARFWLK